MRLVSSLGVSVMNEDKAIAQLEPLGIESALNSDKGAASTPDALRRSQDSDNARKQNLDTYCSQADDNRVQVLPPVMTIAEARQCIEAIKSCVISIRALVLELEERRGWEALGYLSITACLVGEFPGESKTKLIRTLEAGRIERHQQVPIGTYLESQLRPLNKLAPDQWKPALAKAHELAGNDKLKAKYMAQAVAELIEPKPSEIKPVTPPVLPYKPGDIVLIDCTRTVREPYAQYNNCWGVVLEVLAHGANITLMGERWNINWNDIKEIDWVDETLKSVAERIVILLQRNDLDEMERKILEGYHRRQWFTDWQLQLLKTIEKLR